MSFVYKNHKMNSVNGAPPWAPTEVDFHKQIVDEIVDLEESKLPAYTPDYSGSGEVMVIPFSGKVNGVISPFKFNSPVKWRVVFEGSWICSLAPAINYIPDSIELNETDKRFNTPHDYFEAGFTIDGELSIESSSDFYFSGRITVTSYGDCGGPSVSAEYKKPISIDATDEEIDAAGETSVPNVRWISKYVSTKGGISSEKTNPIEGFGNTWSSEIRAYGNIPGAMKWRGGVLSLNERVYGVPFNATSILEFDPVTRFDCTFGTFPSGGEKWCGGVVSKEGLLYCIPYSADTVLVVNTDDRETSEFSVRTGTSKWSGGSLSKDGIIYATPHNDESILEIRTSDNHIEYIGSFIGVGKWSGCVTAPNGKIFFIPFNHDSVLELDPTTKQTRMIGSFPGVAKWSGGVLGKNGMIYAIPKTATSVLEIDPINGTIKAFGTITPAGGWDGGVIATDGVIYCSPSGSRILTIDTDTLKVSEFGMIDTPSDNCFGGVLTLDGNIICMPYSSNKIIEIPVQSGPCQWAISPYVNKY